MSEVLIEPLYDRVVLDPVKEEKTEGGIFIPTTSQGKELRRCKVIAVGPGKLNMDSNEHVPMTLKVDDVVFINPMLGQSLRVSRNKEYMIQREEDIIGRLHIAE